MAAGFLVGALKSWLDKKGKDKQARAAYDARYANNPQWALRNQLLTALWNDNPAIRERFAGAFPDPNDPKNANVLSKTPENVLMNLTTPPRYQGRPGTGFDFASLLLGQGVEAAASAAAAGGGGISGAFPVPVPSSGGSSGGSATGLDAPIVPFDQAYDPFRYRKDR